MPGFPIGDELVGFLRSDRHVSELQDRVAKFFEESRDDVYRYLLTLGLHPPRAQEAVQEVFLRLYTALKNGEDIQSLRGWVFRVAHNHGLRLRERQASEAPFAVLYVGLGPALLGDVDGQDDFGGVALKSRWRAGEFHLDQRR